MGNVTFKKICEVFDVVERTSSRNEMTDILVELYKVLDLEESQIVTYLIQGRLAPMFVKSEFNYSEKSIINVLDNWASTKGISLDAKKTRSETGDIGDTMEIFGKEFGFKDSKYTLKEIYEILWKIVYTSGSGSVERKNDIVVNSVKGMSPIEGKYFVRIICGSLRLGVNVKTLLDVISFVKVGDKSIREELDHKYGSCSDPGVLLNPDWKAIEVTPGMPVLSRLVERVSSFQEVFDRLGDEVLVQPKFDGLRCQIHKMDKEVQDKIASKSIWMKFVQKEEKLDLFGSSASNRDNIRLFTRNLEDVTEMFPEIVDAAASMELNSFILDSEILGWNYGKDTFMTYQETMQRRRKYDVAKLSDSIPVKAMVFDILYRNGQNLLEIDTVDRIELLKKEINDTDGGISLALTEQVSDLSMLNSIFDSYVEKGLEGVIVKMKKGGYNPGSRDYEWIKLKRSMKKGLVDTFDLVVVGYFKGSGRRSDLGLGALLGAVYDDEKDTFETVCKVGTGLDDELLIDMASILKEIEIKEVEKGVVFDKGLEADVWVVPRYVITVEADEVSKNIGKGSGEVARGLSLRFPRLIEFGRDKGPYDATTLNELLSIYNKQKNIVKNA